MATTTPTFPGFPLGVTSGAYDHTLDMTDAGSWNPAYVTAQGGTTAGAEAALAASMAAGTAYLNIHTTVVPGGEIRGFLTPVPEPISAGLLALGGLAALRRRGSGINDDWHGGHSALIGTMSLSKDRHAPIAVQIPCQPKNTLKRIQTRHRRPYSHRTKPEKCHSRGFLPFRNLNVPFWDTFVREYFCEVFFLTTSVRTGVDRPRAKPRGEDYFRAANHAPGRNLRRAAPDFRLRPCAQTRSSPL